MPEAVGKNSAVVRQMNLEIVKRMLYQQAPISRKEIADVTGLTPATITNIISELIAEGSVEVIQESGEEDVHSSGRKRVFLDINRDYACVLGFSLGRDGTNCVLCDFQGKTVLQKQYETMSDEYGVMIHQLQGIISEIRQGFPQYWQKLFGIGISIPGVINAGKGIVLNHGKERTSWVGQPLGETISKFTGLPVRVDNNIRARSCGIAIFHPERTPLRSAMCHWELHVRLSWETRS